MHNISTTISCKSAKLFLLGLYLLISFASVSLAQGTITQPPIIPAGGTSQEKLFIPHNTSQESNKTYLETRLLPGIASSIIGITGALALLFTIVSGIQLLTAYGNTDAAGKAQKTLTWSLIGLLVAGLSYAIVRIIASITV
jgi:hypothetical protein